MKMKAMFAVALSIAAMIVASEPIQAQEASVYHNDYRVIPPLGADHPEQFRPYLAYRQRPPQWRAGMTFEQIVQPIIRQSRRYVVPQLQNCVNDVTVVQTQTNFCCNDNVPEGFHVVRQ